MKEIRLNTLSLRDFQGGTIIFDVKGKDVFIFGANAIGKTRLVSAFNWLLFNKDALGRSDFQLKNLDAQGEAEHGLEHTVEAELSINGEPCILRKVFSEKWTKKRGNVNREFSGHTTNYFINGVPVQEKDYISHIADIAGDESRFRLLTSPMTFPQLHWQKQRSLLLEICGDISDVDIIASNDKLAPLTAILGKHTLEDHRKVVTVRRSEINKEMEKIPIRIDEVRRGTPDVTGIDRKQAEKETQALETALNDAKLRLQGVDTGGSIADLTKRLSGLNADLRKMEEDHRKGSLATLHRLNQQISEAETLLASNDSKIRLFDSDTKTKERQFVQIGDDLTRLRNKWAVIDAETPKIDDPTDEFCLACGQPLPVEQIKEAKENYIRAFNQSKAERLGEINRKGADLKAQSEKLQGEIEALKKERDILTQSLPENQAYLTALAAERDALKASSEDFSGLPHWSETFGEIEVYEEEIKAEREGKAQDIEKIKTEIQRLQNDLTASKGRVDLFVRREQSEKRIEELKLEEKKLSAEFEKLEGELYLIESFIRAKVSMLTTRINEKFETVKFKLFNQLVNGGIEECCQITVGGVPFDSGLNNGARINAGLEIVKVLQQHYQLKAPVFADNAEAVNSLVDVGCQMIRLYVSEDKALRVEVR